MLRIVASTLALLVLTLAVGAEDKKDDKKKEKPAKLTGSWSKDIGDGTVTFEFKSKDKLIATLDAGNKKLVVTCEYSVDKDGLVKGKITQSEGDGDKPQDGYTFKFKFVVDGDKAKLSDYDADNADAVKSLLEGEYKKK